MKKNPKYLELVGTPFPKYPSKYDASNKEEFAMMLKEYNRKKTLWTYANCESYRKKCLGRYKKNKKAAAAAAAAAATA